MNQDISRRQQIKNSLEERGSAMNIDEIARIIRLPVHKIRETLTTFDTEIVRTGYKQYDLLPRTHTGKLFRYTPSHLELKTGTLMAEEDLLYFLTAFRDYQADIKLITTDKKSFVFHRVNANKHMPYSHYSEAKNLYSYLQLKPGDDLIFTCLDILNHSFQVQKEQNKDRDNRQIEKRGKDLADMLVDILSHSYTHYEMDLFLVRKYLFIYPYFSYPPPDSLRNIVTADSRFITTIKDRLLSWNGMTLLTGDDLVVGLKKYDLHSKDGLYIPVNIQHDDEFGGKVAYCTQCSERLIWEPKHGFRHLYSESEWIEAYLPTEFYESKI